MEKITMSKKSILTIDGAFELFIRKCKIKNLTELSISSYEKKMVHLLRKLRRYNIRRNVNKTSCHTFAKNWILNSGDMLHLQKILGNSDLTVTKE